MIDESLPFPCRYDFKNAGNEKLVYQGPFHAACALLFNFRGFCNVFPCQVKLDCFICNAIFSQVCRTQTNFGVASY